MKRAESPKAFATRDAAAARRSERRERWDIVMKRPVHIAGSRRCACR
jgi:hypothetical protein